MCPIKRCSVAGAKDCRFTLCQMGLGGCPVRSCGHPRHRWGLDECCLGVAPTTEGLQSQTVFSPDSSSEGWPAPGCGPISLGMLDVHPQGGQHIVSWKPRPPGPLRLALCCVPPPLVLRRGGSADQQEAGICSSCFAFPPPFGNLGGRRACQRPILPMDGRFLAGRPLLPCPRCKVVDEIQQLGLVYEELAARAGFWSSEEDSARNLGCGALPSRALEHLAATSSRSDRAASLCSGNQPQVGVSEAANAG
mmetsp:Transcript_88362/g.193669  ORF Transcript_88362/g.193669 Transcript_88362/m.193669 type:complete len:250 (+) Transcript_88362:1505-2254(+)